MANIIATVLRDPSIGDCTNGGASAFHSQLWVVDEQQPGIGLPRRTLPQFKLEMIGDWPVLRPVECPSDKIGPMFGGNWAFSRELLDGRPVQIHDRFETPQQYRLLSSD